ncbi:MAG: hypothetical protein OEY49_08865 [Candidatus Heimdallarchaeota archaeon]|nr:hypothetical protein [Candidatus Heimdallarchaeota archaeon]
MGFIRFNQSLKLFFFWILLSVLVIGFQIINNSQTQVYTISNDNRKLNENNKNIQLFTSHSNLTIIGNAALAANATFQGWPGDGSALNPYVIENLDYFGNGTKMSITNTTSFIKFNNTTFNDTNYGLYLTNVSNVLVTNSVFKNSVNTALVLDNTNNITIQNNSFLGNNSLFFSGTGVINYIGVDILNGNNITIQNNYFHNNSKAIVANNITQFMIEANVFEMNSRTIFAENRLEKAIFQNNNFTSNFIGINSDNAIISNNNITNNQFVYNYHGVNIGQSNFNTITFNNFSLSTTNTSSLYFSNSNGSIIQYNTFTGGLYAMYFETITINTIIRWNDFYDVGSIEKIFAGTSDLKVSQNYWSDHVSTDIDLNGFLDTPIAFLRAVDPLPLKNPVFINQPNPFIRVAPLDKSIDFLSSGNILKWNASDFDPQSYVVLKNNSGFTSGDWNDWNAIEVNIDTITNSVGFHNFTIIFTDNQGNSANHTVDIEVTDLSPPVILQTNGTIDIELGSLVNSISWLAIDKASSNTYEIYVNDLLNVTSTWTNNTLVEFSFGYFELGIQNITIVFSDASGNLKADTVFIHIVDTTIPELIITPTDAVFESGSTGHSYAWRATDLDAANYVVLANNTQIDSGSWTSNIEFFINFDDLDIGLWNITIIITDGSGNYIVDELIIRVVDTTNPILQLSQENTEYEFGTSGNIAVWNVIDLNPDIYELYLDGELWKTNDWTNGTNLRINIDEIALGNHNLTIYFFDSSGNSVSDSFILYVFDKPRIQNIADLTFIEGEDNKVSWIVEVSDPDTYEIFLNGTLIDSSSWQSGVPITIDISELKIGFYNLTLTVKDLDGYFNSDIVFISIIKGDGSSTGLIIGLVLIGSFGFSGYYYWKKVTKTSSPNNELSTNSDASTDKIDNESSENTVDNSDN